MHIMCIEHHIVLNIVPCLCNEMCHCVTCVYGLCGFSYTSPFKASYTFVRTTLEKKKKNLNVHFFSATEWGCSKWHFSTPSRRSHYVDRHYMKPKLQFQPWGRHVIAHLHICVSDLFVFFKLEKSSSQAPSFPTSTVAWLSDREDRLKKI